MDKSASPLQAVQGVKEKAAPVVREVTIHEVVTVRELADLLHVTPIQIIKNLMSSGVLASINQQIDFDTAAIVASEFGFEARLPYVEVLEEAVETELTPWQALIANERAEDLQPRPPVVTILGHVDHGKTSLLDAIRHTNVAARETGGITQHIGAYQVEHNRRRITFLDTPGHEAFTAMRARGANTTDIAILVVAADDGIQPQTVEAINHARAAHVPIIVALNKIDKPNARPDFVKQQLADQGLVPDDWGGGTMVIPVSAKKRIGLEDLLEAILLVADSIGVKANPDRPAIGTVLESRLDKQRGPLATILIQNGTLHTSDVGLVGTTYGKIKALEDERGRLLKAAPPSTPVVIFGLHDVPEAGERFEVVSDERTARAIAEKRQEETQAKALAAQRRTLSLDDLSALVREGQIKSLNIVLKTDVQGSIEPIVNSLNRLSNENVQVHLIHSAPGNISESDVNLAVASDAIILGFRVESDAPARRAAEMEGLSIQVYDVIYQLVDDVEKAMKGMLEPTYVEKELGTAEVRATFDIPKVGRVAGCQVTGGVIRRSAKLRVVRRGQVIYQGDVGSLKRFNKDVREVKEGFECGIKVEGFDEIQVGDVLQCFHLAREEAEA